MHRTSKPLAVQCSRKRFEAPCPSRILALAQPPSQSLHRIRKARRCRTTCISASAFLRTARSWLRLRCSDRLWPHIQQPRALDLPALAALAIGLCIRFLAAATNHMIQPADASQRPYVPSAFHSWTPVSGISNKPCAPRHGMATVNRCTFSSTQHQGPFACSCVRSHGYFLS